MKKALLEELVHITSIRDIDKLQLTTLELLSKIVKNEGLLFYSFDGKDRCYKVLSYPESAKEILLKTSRNDKSSSDLYIDIPEYLSLALKYINKGNKYYYQPIDNKYCYVFPHTVDTRIDGYFSLTVEHLIKEHELTIIDKFLSIINNFQNLLEDNQKDKLTNLLNRKTFEDKVIDIQHTYSGDTKLEYTGDEERTNSCEGNFWLAIMDIDFFKKINDNFGHVYGDEVLLLMAGIMRDSFRQNDLLFRFGGEEFVTILHAPNKNTAEHVLERFRKTVEDYHFPQIKEVTISIGVTQLSRQYEIPSDIVGRADKALYYAKDNGRNQLHSFETLISSGALKDETIDGTLDFF